MVAVGEQLMARRRHPFQGSRRSPAAQRAATRPATPRGSFASPEERAVWSSGDLAAPAINTHEGRVAVVLDATMSLIMSSFTTYPNFPKPGSAKGHAAGPGGPPRSPAGVSPPMNLANRRAMKDGP